MSLPGEIEIENRPSTEAKALRINLNSFIYGTFAEIGACLLYTSPSPRDRTRSRMPSSA